MTGYIQRWFTLPQTVTRLWAGKPSLSPIQVLTHEEYGWKSNSRPIDHKSDALTTHTTRPQVQCTVIVLSESQSRSPLDDCDSSLRSDNSIFSEKNNLRKMRFSVRQQNLQIQDTCYEALLYFLCPAILCFG